MLKTYFFVPAINKRYIDKHADLGADYVVFDLEDSVSSDSLAEALENLRQVSVRPNHYIRPTLYGDAGANELLLHRLIDLGFRNFLLPKYRGPEDLDRIATIFGRHSLYARESFSFLVLVEHPAGLFHLYDALRETRLNVTALGLGSHDFCDAIGMQHTLHNLLFARQWVVNVAKACGIDAIDIVSVALGDEAAFREEAYDGFAMGFDGKFLIHPRQQALMRTVVFYSGAEVEEAQAVRDQIERLERGEVAVVSIAGKVYERPHVNRLRRILEWSETHDPK